MPEQMARYEAQARGPGASSGQRLGGRCRRAYSATSAQIRQRAPRPYRRQHDRDRSGDIKEGSEVIVGMQSAAPAAKSGGMPGPRLF
jgi:hypothetical protein